MRWNPIAYWSWGQSQVELCSPSPLRGMPCFALPWFLLAIKIDENWRAPISEIIARHLNMPPISKTLWEIDVFVKHCCKGRKSRCKAQISLCPTFLPFPIPGGGGGVYVVCFQPLDGHWLYHRGVGSISDWGAPKCKPKNESRSRKFDYKVKVQTEDILKMTPPPPAKTKNVLWTYILQKPHKVFSVKAWLLQHENKLNIMDHMRISSTEPSPVILSETK